MERQRQLHIRPYHSRTNLYQSGLCERAWNHTARAPFRLYAAGEFRRRRRRRGNPTVWPFSLAGSSPEWRETDRYPNAEAKSIAWQTFERLNNFTPEAAGLDDEFEKLPFLRFDEQAQAIFSEWRTG